MIESRIGLEDGVEYSRDTAFVIGPRDVACWLSKGWEVREEANGIRTRVDRHARDRVQWLNLKRIRRGE